MFYPWSSVGFLEFMELLWFYLSATKTEHLTMAGDLTPTLSHNTENSWSNQEKKCLLREHGIRGFNAHIMKHCRTNEETKFLLCIKLEIKLFRHIQAGQTCTTELGFPSTIQLQKINLYPISKMAEH